MTCYKHILDQLEKYMFTDEIQSVRVKHIAPTKIKDEIFYPRENDSLFWCFYLIKYGDIQYELSSKNLIEEKKIKIAYIEKMRENKLLLKKYKFATLAHIENQLANEMKIDLSTFFSLCALENINAVYVHKKSYYELVCEGDLHIIHYSDMRYGIETSVNEIYKSFFKMESLDKPIKSVTFYKIAELQEFCVRLGIETVHETKKKNKKELYESIVQFF